MDDRSAPVLVSTANSAPLRIAVFGSFQTTLHAQPLTNFRSNKARALLAYLALAGSVPVARTALTELLWQGYTDSSARANLRQVVYNLRELLDPLDLLQGDYRTIQLTTDAAILWCDALVFADLVDSYQRHTHGALADCPLCQARLQQAAALYKGPFLADFDDIDSPPFQMWLATQRAQYAACYAEVQAALRLVLKLRGNLPQPLTSLIGRSAELSELATKVLHPVYRCLTLIGPGGIGKTRLAIALGEQLGATFGDGVWFVALAGLDPTSPGQTTHLIDRIATTISTTLGLRLQGTKPPAQQLTHYLREKTLLLILDNFEQLSAGVNLLVTLLQEAPQVRLVVTSRHRLAWQGQLVHRVAGLSLPPEIEEQRLPPAQLITHYASLQLFAERAENAALPFERDPAQLAIISALCRFVGGAPLGIELAVALLETQTPGEILQSVRSHYAALQAHWADLPLRQRSAQALLLTAWGLLSASEQALLARCSVFRGGFTLAAAQQIANATPTLLEALIHKSLLHEEANRYTLHELVRQFAAEQLAQDATTLQQCHAAHAAYFAALLATWQLDDATEQQFRAAVTHDWENVQAAWAWAVAADQVALLQQGVRGLSEFYEFMGLYSEFDRTFSIAIARVRLLIDAPTIQTIDATAVRRAAQTLLGSLLWRRIRILSSALGQIEQAQQLAEELVAWGRHLGNRALEACGDCELSMVALYQGDYQRQQALLLRALPLLQQHGDRDEQVLCLTMLGINFKMLREYPTAQAYFEEALALAQALGSTRLAIQVLGNLGSSHWDAGHFTEAIACFQEVLPQAQRLVLKDRMVFTTACLGALACTLGDYATARTYLEQARQGFYELGDQVLEAQILNILGMLFVELGDMATAHEYCRRALASPVAQLYVVQREALITQGHLHRAAGDWPAAQEDYQAAYTLSQEANFVAEWLPIQAYLAALDLAQGKTAAALAAVEPVLANFAANLLAPAQRPQELLLIAYQILGANQDPRAVQVLHQAWAVVQEQASQIDDPALRTAFLTHVPVNRQLGALLAEIVG